MSRTHTADGRRISRMTHAKHGHSCDFCDRVSFGNGGQVAHARAHVRRGEAVELVKEYGPPAGTSRVWLPSGEAERIAEYLSRGFNLQSV